MNSTQVIRKKIWNYRNTKLKRGLHWPLLIPRLWRIDCYEIAAALWARSTSGLALYMSPGG